MQITAKSSSVRVSPRKVRLVAETIRSLSVEEALKSLLLTNKRGAYVLLKTLKSATANATNNKKIKTETLFVKTVDVLDGPSFKRYHPSTRGRIHPYKKRTSNIRIILEEKALKKVESGKEENGTKS